LAKCVGRGKTNAAASAGNKRNLSFKQFHDRSSGPRLKEARVPIPKFA
jgi:hypothetical protein